MSSKSHLFIDDRGQAGQVGGVPAPLRAAQGPTLAAMRASCAVTSGFREVTMRMSSFWFSSSPGMLGNSEGKSCKWKSSFNCSENNYRIAKITGRF